MDMSTVSTVKHGLDLTAIAAWLTAIANVLHPLGSLALSLLSAVWISLRIWETTTVQSWVKKRRDKKNKEQ